jgi:glycosyltransferase involved in cell wall biosynthesis
VVVAKTDPPLISVVAAAVAKMRGAVLVNWLQDLFPEVAQSLGVLENRLLATTLRRLRDASLKVARCNVVIGTIMAERLRAEGLPSNRVTTIPNWSDGEEIHPIDRSANALVAQWGLEGKFVVGYSGNMGRAHEFTTLLEAAERLSANPDIVFLLIGDGAQRASIARYAEQRGLKNVVLKPYQPRELLKLSLGVPHVHAISLQPKLEGLIVPSKFYGVAAAGRSTLYVGDHEGEIPRLLVAHECGWTVEPGQVSELAGRILELAGDDAITEVAGRNARRAFERNFDQRIAMQRWYSLIHGALEGVGGSVR